MYRIVGFLRVLRFLPTRKVDRVTDPWKTFQLACSRFLSIYERINIKKLEIRLIYTMFRKSETSLEFSQLHVFEPYIFFHFVKQLRVVFWMISLSNLQNSSLLVVS